MRLAFLRRNVKGWVLTKKELSFAFGLTKETRAGLLLFLLPHSGQTVPAIWVVSELHMETDGVLQAVWNGPREHRGSLRDCPRIDGDTYRDMRPLGKQTHIPPFVRNDFLS